MKSAGGPTVRVLRVRGAEQAQETLRMAAGAAQAVGRVMKAAAAGRRVLVAESERERRLVVCRGCEHVTADGRRCGRCLCVLRAKVRLATERCPEGKWGGET